MVFLLLWVESAYTANGIGIEGGRNTLMEYKITTSFNKANDESLRIVEEINSLNLCSTETVVFNFEKYCENTPFSNLLIGNTIRIFKNKGTNECLCKPDSKTYLSHLGFYQMIGFDYGKSLGGATANNNYVPILRIDLKGEYETIKQESKKFAELATFDQHLSTFLEYLFIEIVRNVCEHAESNEVYVCAQKWPSKRMLEIAFSDTGCGICRSLGKSPQYSGLDDETLIKKACDPGVTAGSNFYLDKEDVWRNSGYGLYFMRKLAVKYGGSFRITSGNYMFYEDSNGTQIRPTKYQGTTVAIRIGTDFNHDFRAVQEEIRKQGEAEASSQPTAVHSASKTSCGVYNV